MVVNGALTAEPGRPALYPWQNSIWRSLIRYADLDRVPHALLLSGAEGIGKLNLALCFANYLLCTGPRIPQFRCGRCDACRLMAAGTHPDLIRVEPAEAGKPVTIDQIRDLSNTLSLMSQYNRYRIVLFRDADRLNLAAANALLKTLEEPGKDTVLILITARFWDLPATIRSRCQRLDVPLPDRRLARDWLEQQGLGDGEILLAMASGGPLKALAMGRAGDLEARNTVFASWREVAANYSDPVRIAEKLSALPLSNILDWITGWTMDMIRLAMVPSAGMLANPDLRPALQTEAQKLDLKQLFWFYGNLIQSASRLGSSINVQLLLESILIDWYSMKRSR